jgi:hypothetical protein
MKFTSFIILIFVFLVGAGCKPYDPDQNIPPKQVEGWAPIYASSSAIKTVDAQKIDKGGKIYSKGNLLYQIETGKGIHVIDISEPKQPQKLKFIEVNGCQDMAILGNVLYANSVNDLVTIDISDINKIEVTDQKENVFHLVNKNRPPARGWFECIDPSKGEVIGWELKTLYTPKCLY